MPLYRIYRMKDSPRQQFRCAPHVCGCASVKPKDYEQRGQVEAQNDYDAWRQMKDTDEPLAVGDILETEDGKLRLCKYVGLEPAEWALPEQRQHSEPEAAGQAPDLGAPHDAISPGR